jgi:outer membrane autotransporter protein
VVESKTEPMNSSPWSRGRARNTPGGCRNALTLGTAIGALFCMGYSRGAYATCNPTTGTVLCSGTVTSTQNITGPAVVTTSPGFSVDTTVAGGSGGVGIRLGNTGDLSFTDLNGSLIRGVTGVLGANYNTGSLSVSVSGIVQGVGNPASSVGIRVFNNKEDNVGSLSVTTSSASRVSGDSNGIDARQYSKGDLGVTVNGDLTGVSDDGLFAKLGGKLGGSGLSPTGNLTVTIGPDSNVVGSKNTYEGSLVGGVRSGIYAAHYGIGALTVTTGQNSSVKGAASGIQAEHRGRGDIKITTGTGSEVIGKGNGITVRQLAAGDLSVTVSGDVKGGGYYGIYTNAGYFGKLSSGNLTVTVSDAVNVSGATGIFSRLFGPGDLSITTSSDSVVSGTSSAIRATNFYGGGLSVVANGVVSGGIYGAINTAAYESVTHNITVGGTGEVLADSSNLAIRARGEAVTVSNSGIVDGYVDLTDENDMFLNNGGGTWFTAGLTSTFGFGVADRFDNAGLVIAAVDDGADELTKLNDLELFTNKAGGIVRLADGGAGDVFYVPGDFAADGGLVELDVEVGDDDSPADLLRVGGNVTLAGTTPTGLLISPVGGGTGAKTTTGIKVVDVVRGTSTPGAFVLANSAPLEVGAFVYDLSLGGCAGELDQSWYLCSTDEVGTVATLLESMPNILLNAFARPVSLDERIGKRIYGPNEGSEPADDTSPLRRGPWARAWGDWVDVTPGTSTAGSSWEGNNWGLQAGIDFPLISRPAGEVVMGANIQYTAAEADTQNDAGTGKISTDGFGIGATLTWYGTNGLYVDTQATAYWTSTDAQSAGSGVVLNEHDANVFMLSGEVGKQILLGGGIAVVPQAQLSWGSVDEENFTDELENAIAFGNADNLIGRAGISIERNIMGDTLPKGTAYAFGNILHDFSGETSVVVAGTELTQSGAGTWGELGGGFTLPAGESLNVFAQVSYRHGLWDVEGNSLSASGGLRVNW